MKVILQQDVAGLGAVGQVVRVKDGYARNFLVPRGLAMVADEHNVHRMDHLKRMAASRAAREVSSARELAERISATAVSIKREAGDEGKLFGSVTNRDIADAFAAEGFELDRRHIVLDEPIRNIGVFTVPVKLHREVTAQAKVYVIQQ